MKSRDHNIIAEGKRNLEGRLARRGPEADGRPVRRGGNCHDEMAGRTRAVPYGGLGAVHQLARKLGLDRELNGRLKLLKIHNPYCESDHVLNLAYNVLCGGTCLEDLELRRQSAPYLDVLGARSIPDPTTAGDFLRRFTEPDLIELMEVINDVRERAWEAREIVFSANRRCDQENLIGQLKSGIHALRMPAADLLANGAYMVIAALAWNLKAWFALRRAVVPLLHHPPPIFPTPRPRVSPTRGFFFYGVFLTLLRFDKK